jgi:hypothetical protein
MKRARFTEEQIIAVLLTLTPATPRSRGDQNAASQGEACRPDDGCLYATTADGIARRGPGYFNTTR